MTAIIRQFETWFLMPEDQLHSKAELAVRQFYSRMANANKKFDASRYIVLFDRSAIDTKAFHNWQAVNKIKATKTVFGGILATVYGKYNDALNAYLTFGNQ
jgi:hypothetical protein